MNVVFIILLILHFLGLASLLGAFLVQLRDVVAGKGRVLPAMVHGALTQLVTGVLMIGILEAGLLGSERPDMGKYAVKLAVVIVITVLVFVFRKRNPAPSFWLWAIGVLTLANTVIAVAWR